MGSIRISIAAFPPKAGYEYEDSPANVTRITKIVQDLRQQVEELQARQMPSTPLEVLEERRRVGSKAVEKIREEKELCAKATDVVATIWGALLKDETNKEIRKSA